jgi:AraC-like DNA-binding protein
MEFAYSPRPLGQGIARSRSMPENFAGSIVDRQLRSAAAPIAIFDTSQLPKQDRYDAWCDHVGGVVASFDFNVGTDCPFFGRMETLTAGPIRVNRGDCSSGRWDRRRRHLPDGREHFCFYLVGEGSFRLTQGDVDTTHGPDHFALIDDGRPSEFYASSSRTDLGFVVPRDALARSLRRKDLGSHPMVGTETGSLRLLRSYVEAVYASSGDLCDPVTAEKVGWHLIDLIGLSLQPSRDAVDIARHRGLKAARLRSILAEINKHFCSAEIGSKMIAAKVNISERYLHQLLDEEGLTFSHMVRDLRLEKAFAMLRDQALDHLHISQIAYETGFNDLSYFSRCFRARFGDSPSGIRAVKWA